MSGLRGSAHYIWFESDVLGQGATGAVYKARHKRTGELYAVKTFNHMGQMRPMDVQMREFQVLQKVNHENVVKLLAIEEESLSNNKVIIMELCTGGSLFNMLEEPKNSLGIEEKDFFTVLGDVASGLKHLRELGVVHRDIKPGNIMLYNSEDGRHIYKLTDFGAARELDDEEQFMSLYGTEEYLYPDMYARAVLRRPVDRHFDATVDLWSLGVTLYHVATGHLPFRPFGGRSNKHTMYQMTASKDAGVISGIQHESGGPIEYSRELPDTCPLSKGARFLVTPLLAGLMESKEEKMWTFEKFFDEVHSIINKHIIYVFNTYEGTLLHLFLDPDEKMVHFQEAIARQTDIPANLQDLILDRGYLTDHVTHMLEVHKYPVTTPEDPIFLFYKCDHGESWEFPPYMAPELPKCPLTNNPTLNLQADYTQSKTSTGLLHHIKRKMADCHRNQTLMGLAARVFLFILVNNICRLQSFSHQFLVVVEETQKRMRWIQVQHDRNMSLLRKLLDGQATSAATSRQYEEYKRDGEKLVMEHSEKLYEVADKAQQYKSTIDGFYGRVVKNGELSWEHIAERACKDTDKCQAKIDYLLVEMELTVKNFRTDKKKRGLSHNEEQIHKFERHKVKSNCDKANQTLQTTCCSGGKNVFRNFAGWFKWSSEVRSKLNDIDVRMEKLTQTQANISQKLDVCQSKHLDSLERIVSGQTAPRDIEQDYVMYNKEDAPINLDVSNSSKDTNSNRGNKNNGKIKLLNGEIASLKTDTENIRQWIEQNNGLLNHLKSFVDET